MSFLQNVALAFVRRSYLVKDDIEKTNIEVFDELNIQNYNNTFGKLQTRNHYFQLHGSILFKINFRNAKVGVKCDLMVTNG